MEYHVRAIIVLKYVGTGVDIAADTREVRGSAGGPFQDPTLLHHSCLLQIESETSYNRVVYIGYSGAPPAVS
jgi:hypothetical protein